MEILHGDCLELMKTLPDESIDLIITSPPYADLKTYKDFKGISADEYVDWIFPRIQEIFRVLKPTGSFILNINDKVENRFRHPYVFDLVSKICRETEFKMFERLFWNKMKGLAHSKRFGDRVEFIFWFVKSKDFTFHIDEMRVPYTEGAKKRLKYDIKKRFVRTEEEQPQYKEMNENEKGGLPTTLVNISSEVKRVSNIHFAVFPEQLVEYFIKGSTNVGDVVLDTFMGTGTTLRVCERLGRKSIGMDINEY
jgi:site-specific DNA-methyltransferase (adenine-specific)